MMKPGSSAARRRNEYSRNGTFTSRRLQRVEQLKLEFFELQVATQEQLVAAFRFIDIDGNGVIEVSELVKLWQDMGRVEGLAEAQALMESYDVDGSGYLDLYEFAKVWLSGQYCEDVQMQVLKRAFELLDSNDDGLLSKDEINEFFTCNHVDQPLEKDEIDRFFKLVGKEDVLNWHTALPLLVNELNTVENDMFSVLSKDKRLRQSRDDGWDASSAAGATVAATGGVEAGAAQPGSQEGIERSVKGGKSVYTKEESERRRNVQLAVMDRAAAPENQAEDEDAGDAPSDPMKQLGEDFTALFNQVGEAAAAAAASPERSTSGEAYAAPAQIAAAVAAAVPSRSGTGDSAAGESRATPVPAGRTLPPLRGVAGGSPPQESAELFNPVANFFTGIGSWLDPNASNDAPASPDNPSPPAQTA